MLVTTVAWVLPVLVVLGEDVVVGADVVDESALVELSLLDPPSTGGFAFRPSVYTEKALGPPPAITH